MALLALVVNPQYDADVQQPKFALVGPRFGEAVIAARAALSWSQRTLADQLTSVGVNLDASGVSRIENGTRMPRLDEAVAIANVTGMDLQGMLWEPAHPEVQVPRGAQRLERLRESLLRDLAYYNRLRLELALAADDLELDPTTASDIEDANALVARVESLMIQGPVDLAIAYEESHSDASEQLAGRSSAEAVATIAARDRSIARESVEPHTGAFLDSTLYRGSDNSSVDRHQLGRSPDGERSEAP